MVLVIPGERGGGNPPTTNSAGNVDLHFNRAQTETETAMSWQGKLRQAQAEMATLVDPWKFPLGGVRGKTDYDGLERVTTQSLLDMLEVPQRARTAATCRRLAKLMTELGWT